MPVHEKILLVDIEKPGIATWLFYIYFHFSVIFFYVYICETYATLDTAKGEKSGFIILFAIFMLCDIENIVSVTLAFVCFEQDFRGCFEHFADFQMPYLTNVSFCATIRTSPIGKSH